MPVLAHLENLHLTPSWHTAAAVMALGIFHGLNPGMGWLFALSYGLQERSATRLVKSMVPIAAGHELSVSVVAVTIVLFSSAVSQASAALIAGAVMMAFGTWLFFRKRHFRWVGMRLTPVQLGWWSFLMSTVTGAGLMLAPVLLGSGPATTDQTVHSALEGNLLLAVAAALLHATAMFVTATATALAVYKLMGLKVLRVAWINLDKLWALTFIAAGAFVWVH